MTTTPHAELLTEPEIMGFAFDQRFKDGPSYIIEFARAIERALLAKLREQQPVAWDRADQSDPISIAKKHGMENHNGAPGKYLASQYKVPLYAAPVPTPAPVGAQEREVVTEAYEALYAASTMVTTRKGFAQAHFDNGSEFLVIQYNTWDAAERARKALRLLEEAARPAAQAAQAVPAGWKLVPVEPNTAMLDAVSSCHEGRLYPQDFVHGPRAMRRQEYATWLAAAPTPTGAGDEGGDHA